MTLLNEHEVMVINTVDKEVSRLPMAYVNDFLAILSLHTLTVNIV